MPLSRATWLLLLAGVSAGVWFSKSLRRHSTAALAAHATITVQPATPPDQPRDVVTEPGQPAAAKELAAAIRLDDAPPDSSDEADLIAMTPTPPLAAPGVLSRRLSVRALWLALQLMLWVVLLGFVVLVAIPRVSHFDIMIVRSGSMEPAIHVGSVVVVDRSTTALTVGDTGTFIEPSGDVVTHRVIAAQDGLYETKGDANASPDSGVRSQADVIGRVAMTIPLVGYALYLLERPPVFLLLLSATGGFLIVDQMRVIYRESRRIRAERRLRNA